MKEGKEYMKPPEPHMCVMTMTTVSFSLKRLKIIFILTVNKTIWHAVCSCTSDETDTFWLTSLLKNKSKLWLGGYFVHI